MNAYDWVLTRYVGALAKSAAYCLPLLNATGRWIAYKSNEKDVEIHESKKVLQQLRGEIVEVHYSRIAQLNRCYIVVCRADRGT